LQITDRLKPFAVTWQACVGLSVFCRQFRLELPECTQYTVEPGVTSTLYEMPKNSGILDHVVQQQKRTNIDSICSSVESLSRLLNNYLFTSATGWRW